MKVATLAVAALLARSSHAALCPDNDDNNNDPGRNLAAGGNGIGRPAEDEIDLIVKYKNQGGHDDVKNKFAKDKKVRDIVPGRKISAFRTKKVNMKAVKMNKNIEYVEIDAEVHALPNMRGSVNKDNEASNKQRRLAESTPYGITQVQADQLEQGSNNVKICVIDTGYDLNHEDLPNTTIGFVPSDNQSERWDVDGNGHGTHCAGTIGAIGGNDKGVTSVNPNPAKFSFFIGKGLSDSGSGSLSGVLEAVNDCINSGPGPKVISMSLGGGGPSQSANDTYKAAYDSGALVIAAAGNDGNANKGYPASYAHVMSVAAVDSNETKADFSQYNDQVEIAGPGVATLSTIPGNAYGIKSGTSMATPHVAGVAALVWSHFPECTNEQIRTALLRTAKDKGEFGCDVNYGHGIVQAKAAYDLLLDGCDVDGSPEETIGGCAQLLCTSNDDCDDSNPCNGVETCNTGTGICNAGTAPSPPLSGCHTFEVSITPDNYPSETTWLVKDPDGATILSGNVGGQPQEMLYFPKTGEHEFTINDAYGDGICCSFGSGSYRFLFDGIVMKSGGEFASSESTLFNVTFDQQPTQAPVDPPTEALVDPPTEAPVPPPTEAPVNPPTEAPVDPPTEAPVDPPTEAPVDPPTEAPVDPPTEVPVDTTLAPVPSLTLAPISPPTGSPVASPTEGPGTCTDIIVDILTDNWPTETSWRIKDSGNNTVMSMSNGAYTSIGVQPSSTICLEDGSYTFNIADSYGDGICCSEGTGNYELKTAQGTITSGGDFGTSAAHIFTLPLSSLPNPSSPFELSLLTDSYGGETTWILTGPSGVVSSGGPYPGNTQHEVSGKLSDGCYTLIVSDAYGDGICCNYGNGSYTLSVNGELEATGSDFTDRDITNFCIGGAQASAQTISAPSTKDLVMGTPATNPDGTKMTASDKLRAYKTGNKKGPKKPLSVTTEKDQECLKSGAKCGAWNECCSFVCKGNGVCK